MLIILVLNISTKLQKKLKTENSIRNYEDCLQKLKDENIAVGMVQVGNETSGGKMAGETRFSFFAGLFKCSNTVTFNWSPAFLHSLFANVWVWLALVSV